MLCCFLSHGSILFMQNPLNKCAIVKMRRITMNLRIRKANYVNIFIRISLLCCFCLSNFASACQKISSWHELFESIHSASLQSNPILVLCPFVVIHEGNEDSGFDMTTPNLSIYCAVSSSEDNSKCEIRGSARHFNILADRVTLKGITFYGSQYGAVSVTKNTKWTSFIECRFSK